MDKAMDEMLRPGGHEIVPTQDVIGFIVDHEQGLSRSHRLIARAILDHPKKFVETPIEGLVSWLGVSAPTVTRFSRVIGCEGLRDLKLKVMSSMRVGARYFEPEWPPNTMKEASEYIIVRSQRAVEEAQRTIDFSLLEQAVDLISRSRMIYAFGGGGVSNWLIEEVHNRLFRIGLRTTTSCDHQMQMMLAATVERGDVLFCVSLSGNNAELVKAARIAEEYGASTIALTQPNTPVAQAVQLALTTAVQDDRDVIHPTCLRYAFLSIIDLLGYGAAFRSRPLAQEKLRRIKQQFTTYRDADDSQPVCD